MKTSQTVAEISIFCDFEDGGRHHPGLMKNSKLSVHCRGLLCVNVPNFIKTGQTVAEIWRFNGFFSKWRPSAILDLLGAYLVVSIFVQNLVEIDVVISII